MGQPTSLRGQTAISFVSTTMPARALHRVAGVGNFTTRTTTRPVRNSGVLVAVAQRFSAFLWIAQTRRARNAEALLLAAADAR